ncbi:MAG: glycoside hydrolase [Burkholderiales bacterium PBB3]|nr:MAG: glycoside hydrolase [Burkholderiales bacterium PBB3]
MRFESQAACSIQELEQRSIRAGDSVIIDFGGHRTGYLSFKLRATGREADAPVRLRLVFGEVLNDVASPLYPYSAWLSQAWLPEEIITVDDIPQDVRVPRRHAFRFVLLEVIATSKEFAVQVHKVRAHAVTSAPATFNELPTQVPDWVRRVDEVSIATLRDCMQTCFEDGPRRARRLWIGDLRLQAMTSYRVYGNEVDMQLVKRCLYLFAGLPREDGLVNACVYERPRPTYANIVALDYSALYAVVLCEYVVASGDHEAGLDLWPVARRQLELLLQHVGPDGLFSDPGDVWIFIDWADELERSSAMQGVLLFSLQKLLALAQILGLNDEVVQWKVLAQQMQTQARAQYWDTDQQLFVSGEGGQVSCASQAWLVLAGVAPDDLLGAAAVRKAMERADSVKPVTPYLYHYLVEALHSCGDRAGATALLKHYWGGMAELGADTFWEAYNPKDPLHSPYGDSHANSYCHAWSCTPAFFFRETGFFNVL